MVVLDLVNGDRPRHENIISKEMNSCIRTLLHIPRRTVVLHSLKYSKAPDEKLKLPKLPVPSLQDTLTKYLKSVTPFLSKEEFSVTERLVKEFGSSHGIGKELQRRLECRYEEKDNWLSEWWLKTAYLGFRYPVVVYSSPGLVFPKRTFKDDEEKLTFASRLVTAAIDYKLKIDQDKIPVEKMGKNPLDMSQYKKIFGTCRIPKIPYDELVYNPNSKHIVVIHNNHFFKMDVVNDKGSQFNESSIKKALKEIIEKTKNSLPPVGILTSLHRDKWSVAFEELCKDEPNQQSWNTIASSLFTLSFDKCCYDPGQMVTCKPNHMSIAGMQCVTGGGPEFNGGNRWYDKTIQFVIDSKGHNGLTYEHSPAEGQPIAVMMDHVVKYVDEFKEGAGSGTDGDPKPQEIPFNITPAVLEHIEDAAKDLAALNFDVDMECFKFAGYGKDFIKSQKLSPDSYIQMAIQYAFYRIHQTPGAHYESAATRMFHHGRTETIRSCSVESVKFCTDMLSCSTTNIDKAKSLRAAITAHKDYTNMALQGLGVDRHLLGLKMIAIENNMGIPELYLDEGCKRSLHMRISTSQVASLCDGFMVYGPIVEDGYACCYNPRKDDINFGTTSFKSCPQTLTLKWKDSLIESLNDMKIVLEQAPQAKL